MIHLPLEYIIYFKLKKDKKKMLRYSTILVIEVKIHKKHCHLWLGLTANLFFVRDIGYLLTVDVCLASVDYSYNS